MQVGAEFPFLGRAAHCGHTLVPDDQTTDVRPSCLLDELLDEDVGIQSAEGFDDRFRRLRGFREDHADSLGPFQKLNDEGGAATKIDEMLSRFGIVGESGDGQADPFACEKLKAAELVPGTVDGDAFVHAVDAHHFKLPDHGGSEKGMGRPDPRNDGIEATQLLIAQINPGLWDDVHVTLEVVDHMDFVAASFARAHQAAGGKETFVAGKDADFQNGALFVSFVVVLGGW